MMDLSRWHALAATRSRLPLGFEPPHGVHLMPMTLDMQKEEFSHAYVKAIAACAGFSWSKPSVDDDSVDLCLHQRGGGGTIRSPRLDLQLKCKASELPTDSDFSYSLKIKNYDDLRDPNVQVPRILVVVLVPDAVDEWLDHGEPQMALRRGGYWHSLRGLGFSANDQAQTVKISRTRQFNVASLLGMMERIGNGGLP